MVKLMRGPKGFMPFVPFVFEPDSRSLTRRFRTQAPSPSARQPMSRRQNPSGQSMTSTAA